MEIEELKLEDLDPEEFVRVHLVTVMGPGGIDVLPWPCRPDLALAEVP